MPISWTLLGRIRDRFEPPTWSAFEGVWLHDRASSEVACDLALSIGAVYLAKSRVLKRLRKELMILAEDVPHYVPLIESGDAGGMRRDALPHIAELEDYLAGESLAGGPRRV